MTTHFRVYLQEKKVQALEETYGSWKLDHLEIMAAYDVQDFVEECTKLIQDVERAWDKTWRLLQERRSDDLDEIGHLFITLFGKLARLLTKVRSTAADFSAKTGRPIEGVDDLNKGLSVIHERIKTIGNSWPWRDRPWPPLNRDMQAQSRLEQDGPGESPETTLQRLQLGGPLLPE